MCRTGATLLCLFALMLATGSSAPAPTLKGSSSNKVIQDDEQFLSQDDREKVVADIILQLARDFDEGRLTLDDLEGRSGFDQELADAPADEVSTEEQPKSDNNTAPNISTASPVPVSHEKST